MIFYVLELPPGQQQSLAVVLQRWLPSPHSAMLLMILFCPTSQAVWPVRIVSFGPSYAGLRPSTELKSGLENTNARFGGHSELICNDAGWQAVAVDAPA